MIRVTRYGTLAVLFCAFISSGFAKPYTRKEILAILQNPTAQGNIIPDGWSKIEPASPLLIATEQAAREFAADASVQEALAGLLTSRGSIDHFAYERLMGTIRGGMGGDGDWFRADAGRASESLVRKLESLANGVLEHATISSPNLLNLLARSPGAVSAPLMNKLLASKSPISAESAQAYFNAGAGNTPARALFIDKLLESDPKFMMDFFSAEGKAYTFADTDFNQALALIFAKRGIDIKDPAQVSKFLATVNVSTTSWQVLDKISEDAVRASRGTVADSARSRAFALEVLQKPDFSRRADIVHALTIVRNFQLIENDTRVDWALLVAKLGRHDTADFTIHERGYNYEGLDQSLSFNVARMVSTLPANRVNAAVQSELLAQFEGVMAGEHHLVSEPLTGIHPALTSPDLVVRTANIVAAAAKTPELGFYQESGVVTAKRLLNSAAPHIRNRALAKQIRALLADVPEEELHYNWERQPLADINHATKPRVQLERYVADQLRRCFAALGRTFR